MSSNQTTEHTTEQPQHTYVAFYKTKKMTVQAATSYEAQRKAALMFGAGRKTWDVTVMLVQKADGQTVVHSGAEL